MSAIHFAESTSISSLPSGQLSRQPNAYRSQSVKCLQTKRKVSVSVTAEPSQTAPEKPVIELEFIGPKTASDGRYPVEKARAISGEKLLRNIMLDNKMELYATYVRESNELWRWWNMRNLHC
ncbi:hypothetical protein LINPERHAP1_LOCUS26600 [Linum perenne]